MRREDEGVAKQKQTASQARNQLYLYGTEMFDRPNGKTWRTKFRIARGFFKRTPFLLRALLPTTHVSATPILPPHGLIRAAGNLGLPQESEHFPWPRFKGAQGLEGVTVLEHVADSRVMNNARLGTAVQS